MLDNFAMYVGYAVMAASSACVVLTLIILLFERAFTLVKTQRGWGTIKAAIKDMDERKAAAKKEAGDER